MYIHAGPTRLLDICYYNNCTDSKASLLQVTRHFTLDGTLNVFLGDPGVFLKHGLQVGVAPGTKDVVEPGGRWRGVGR